MRNFWLALAGLFIFGMLAIFTYWPVLHPSADPARSVQLQKPASSQPPHEAPPRRTLTVCSDVWMPYAGQPGGAREGYLIDIMRQIYEPLGFRVDYRVLPWTRCVDETRAGKIDALVGTVFSQTPDLIYPESSLGLDQSMFFTLPASGWRYADLKDLGRVRLGAVQDYDYNEVLDRYIRMNAASGKVWFARGDAPVERLVSALQNRTIDVFVENQNVAEYFQKQHRGRVRLRQAGMVGTAVRVYAAFSPRGPEAEELARLLDRRIDDLRGSGELKAILDRYGLVDWRSASAAIRGRQP